LGWKNKNRKMLLFDVLWETVWRRARHRIPASIWETWNLLKNEKYQFRDGVDTASNEI
jgi:hypothetical protein